MKRFIFLIVTFLVLSASTPVVLCAQQASPQWFLVMEEFVASSDRQQFMEVQKEAVGLWKKHNLDVSIFAHLTDDNSLYWVVPIRNFASIDTLYQKTKAFSEKAKQEGYDGSEKFRDLSTFSQTVMMWDPELSYHLNDRFGEPDKNYKEWMFVYLLSGHEEEAAAVIKKYIDFYSKNNIDYPWDTFRVLFGSDSPALIMMTSAKDRVSLHTLEAEIEKQYQEEELVNMWNEFSSHVRRMENKTGWFSPSLSHFPQ